MAARARGLCAAHGGIPRCRIKGCDTKVYVRGKCKRHLAEFGKGDRDIESGAAETKPPAVEMTNAEAAAVVLSDSDSDDYGPRAKAGR
eukprot:CAMPEP_0203832772 /NCGR_PEP_ID=MMETSP0115-20131106/71566_1 /ASSEMBLY_ACC=CAM_ASM_000227 /TAXON_ID=33651 /ORGANISM="Bicosoecid sp, Strain ms1" /LENGTH=87 /DNA_ID=CAMNT_0050741841 /DNA_START=36 /DNA_END=295 /DNA_ORIENTATION=+